MLGIIFLFCLFLMHLSFCEMGASLERVRQFNRRYCKSLSNEFAFYTIFLWVLKRDRRHEQKRSKTTNGERSMHDDGGQK